MWTDYIQTNVDVHYCLFLLCVCFRQWHCSIPLYLCCEGLSFLIHAHSKSTKGVLKIANFAIIVHKVFMSAGQENSLTFKRHRKYTLLPPANVVYKGYVFTGVCLSTGALCVCYPSMHCRWYPSMPCSRSGGGGLWVSQHALLKGIWFCSGGWGAACSGGCLLGGCLLWGVWRPPVTATAAIGTHPTGMHSCFILKFHFS